MVFGSLNGLPFSYIDYTVCVVNRRGIVKVIAIGLAPMITNMELGNDIPGLPLTLNCLSMYMYSKHTLFTLLLLYGNTLT